MPFPESVKIEALLKSRRCCCVCREFCGRDIYVHHIVHESKGGHNTQENAIPLCSQCHSEAGHYNDEHPLGTKYSPRELKRHRDDWYEWCEKNQEKMLPDFPIGISPSKLSLQTGQWKTEGIIRIYNRTDETVESVYSILTAENVNPEADKLNIEWIGNNGGPILKAKDLEIHGDCFALRCSMPDGRPALLILVSSLAPRECITFRTKVDSSAPNSNITYNCAVIEFNNESISILNNDTDDSAAFTFKPPLNITIKGFVFNIKKTKK